MADRIGTIEFPPGDSGNKPVADPLLTKLGQFLSTYVNAQLGEDWQKIAPGQRVPIRSVTTANSTRAFFEDNDLPKLFVFRHIQTPEKTRDDFIQYVSQIFVLWMPDHEQNEARELRDPFSARVNAAIAQALKLGRHKYWVDPGDTTPGAPTRGSVFMRRAGLIRSARLLRTEFDPKIKIRNADHELIEYDATLLTIECVEGMTRDPSEHGVPSAGALSLSVSQGGAGATVADIVSAGAFVVASKPT